MKPVIIFLVKPHPPSAILDGRTPIREAYRYNWQPVSLQYLAHRINRAYGNRVQVKVWHLMDRQDDELFLKGVSEQLPSIVAFSELDLLVNEVNALASRIKWEHPDIWTVVGGKQTSLLRAGDRFPFRTIDFAFQGDGGPCLEQLVKHRLSAMAPGRLPGLVLRNERGIVTETPGEKAVVDFAAFDGPAVRSVPIENRNSSAYIDFHQRYPSIGRDEPRTASILMGTGCPYACSVCQSPVEYGNGAVFRNNDDVAREILWLIQCHGANNFFSLEFNMNLHNVRDLYGKLEALGVDSLSLSGFVRAADIVKAHEAGLLKRLAAKGVRVLSIGLDVPSQIRGDVYNKLFTYDQQLRCLEICEELGIIVLATAIAGPDGDRKELAAQLRVLSGLPAADVDVRLAIALRNTPYFRSMEKYLLYHPDRDGAYYDRQNYRYQTIQMPGMITPEETYQLIREFQAEYLFSRTHTEYVLRMLRNHPDTLPFFERQYRNPEPERKRLPAEIAAAVSRAHR